MSTLPGTAEAQIATIQANDWVSTDAEGDLLVYERWGASIPSRVLAEFPLERYVRDLRVHQILEGTNEIMRMIIGRRMLMENATQIIQ